MSDEKRGLYRKYKVERVDGSSKPEGKHEDCQYFVLDMEHDPHARVALRAYADSCKKDFPGLAKDLRKVTTPDPDCSCRSSGHESCGRVFGSKPSFGGA